MNIKQAAPVLGITAVVVLAIAAFQLLGPLGRVGGPNATPEPTVTAIPTPLPTPTLRPVTSLDEIVLDEGRVGRGFTLDNTYRDATEIATYPVRSARATDLALRELATLQGGVATELSASDAVIVSWVAEFRGEVDAERALGIYLDDFTASDGWGLELVGTSTAEGPEGANFEGTTTRFVSGRPGEAVPALIRIWRYGRVLLAVGAFFDYDEGRVHFLGDNMAGRAQRYTGMDR
jgi:hypothetical protein